MLEKVTLEIRQPFSNDRFLELSKIPVILLKLGPSDAYRLGHVIQRPFFATVPPTSLRD